MNPGASPSLGGNYSQTLVTAPTAPSTTSMFDLQVMEPLIRELVYEGYVKGPVFQTGLTSARSFFKGDDIIKTDILFSNLKYGQVVKVPIKKDQNPFDLFSKSALTYRDIDDCHEQIDLGCEMPCLNTLPAFEYIDFRFDTEYSFGVRACALNEDFWDFNFFTEQYALSRQAYEFGREVDLWNKVITGLIASPAQTVDAALAQAHPTHYWSNLGTVTAAARETVPMAVWYMTSSYEGLNPTVFVTQEFATELIKSVETAFNLNTNIQKVDTFKEWEVPGFMAAESVSTILGLPGTTVVVMKRSPWLTYANNGSLVSQFPLWSTDGQKQYVAILDPRVGYQFDKEAYHLVINPYDCDKLVRGMQDLFYVGSGITFPLYGMVLEFDKYEYYVGGDTASA